MSEAHIYRGPQAPGRSVRGAAWRLPSLPSCPAETALFVLTLLLCWAPAGCAGPGHAAPWDTTGAALVSLATFAVKCLHSYLIARLRRDDLRDEMRAQRDDARADLRSRRDDARAEQTSRRDDERAREARP